MIDCDTSGDCVKNENLFNSCALVFEEGIISPDV